MVVAMGTIGFVRPEQPPVPTFGFEVVRSYPHDRQAFTQGLIYRDGWLYEGTGLNGRSGIRKVKLETGEVVQVQPLDPQHFGEGITDWKGSLIQLTWRSEVGFVYDLTTFKQTKTFRYRGEGWGITHDRYAANHERRIGAIAVPRSRDASRRPAASPFEIPEGRSPN